MIAAVSQRPLLRSMSLALLLEGVLVVTAAVLMSHQLFNVTHPAPPPQMVSLVTPEAVPTAAPAPTPVPVKAPAPVPRPVMHNQPRPAPMPHVVAPPAPVEPPSPLATAAENRPQPVPTPPPAQAPVVAGPNPADVFGAQLRAAVQSAVLYPFALKQMGLTGQTEVEFDYLDGNLSNIHVVRSSTVSAFDHAALAAVQSAPLPAEPPALLGHKHSYRVTVAFHLG